MRNLKLETLAQTWPAWFTATGFAYKHYDTISIIHISRTRAGLKLDKQSNPYHKTRPLDTLLKRPAQEPGK